MNSIFYTTSFILINKNTIEEEWYEIDIYPINPFKILDKIPKSMTQLTIIFFSQVETINPFENILLEDFSIDANILHSANIISKNLLFIKESLQNSIYKYISQLISIMKWFLVENVNLKLELKNIKILLNNKKT